MYTHFIDGKNEAPRHELRCPRPHSWYKSQQAFTTVRSVCIRENFPPVFRPQALLHAPSGVCSKGTRITCSFQMHYSSDCHIPHNVSGHNNCLHLTCQISDPPKKQPLSGFLVPPLSLSPAGSGLSTGLSTGHRTAHPLQQRVV